MTLKEAIAHLFTAVKYILLGGLFVLSYICPRDKSLWVFGAKGGMAFVDNSKYLYLYTTAEREHIRTVWLSKNDDVIEELRESGFEAYHTNSMRGILLNLRAKYVFVSHGIADTNRWCFGGATVVNLWHGIGLKEVSWRRWDTDNLPLNLLERLVFRVFRRCDRFVVTSEAMVEPFSSGRQQATDRIITTGYPRNDFLEGLAPGYSLPNEAELYETYKQLAEDRTLILYVPTYHTETGERIEDHLRLPELDSLLTEINAQLLIKLHPNDQFDGDSERLSRITTLPSQIDIYPLLNHTDALITDYSSIYFDYLTLDKPVVFYPFDLNEYRETRGFFLDYEHATPGPVATDFDQLKESIERITDTDTFTTERQDTRDKYLYRPTESRCKNICDLFDYTSDHRNK